LKPVKKYKPIHYPKPDGQLIFSKSDLLYWSGVHHQEGAPSHLKAKDHSYHLENNSRYGSPEIYYCPADVYSLTEKNGQKVFSIQAQNCLHCKACDIKNVHQNIQWTPPQGGDGPHYKAM
jgi:electron-transferring-flavoprotein dehydrogenase